MDDTKDAQAPDDAIIQTEPPELAYWTRWVAPRTVLGVTGVAWRMIRSRPLPFILLSVLTAQAELLETLFNDYLSPLPKDTAQKELRELLRPVSLFAEIITTLCIVVMLQHCSLIYRGAEFKARQFFSSIAPCLIPAIMVELCLSFFFIFDNMLVVAGFFLISVRLLFVTPFLLFERQGVFRALHASWETTRPIQWLMIKIIGAYILPLLAVVLALIPLSDIVFKANNHLFLDIVFAQFVGPLEMLLAAVVCWLYLDLKAVPAETVA